MSELRPLLDGNADELALLLLRSADDDSPSPDSLKAAAVVLGIGTSLGGSALLVSALRSAAGPGAAAGGGVLSQAAIAASPAATAAGASITLGLLAKQVAIGLVTGIVAMGGLELASEHPFASRASTASVQGAFVSPARATPGPGAASHSTALSEPVVAVVDADAANHSAPSSANDVAAARWVRRRTSVPGAPAGVPPAGLAPAAAAAASPELETEPAPEAAKPQAVALNKSLAAEVALLDRARSALFAQNASDAVRVLEQYRKERQTGILDPEATVLQIQALEKLGERAAASRLARQFIASHPDSRHVDSLRVLAAEAQ
jgi:hypothetical protein